MTRERFLIFYTPRWEQPLTAWLETLPPDAEATLFELEPRIPEPLRERLPHVTYEDFLSDTDFDAIDRQALSLAQNWYLAEEDVSLTDGGTSLGKLVEYEVVIPLVAALKHLNTVRAITARMNPVTFVCFDRSSGIGQALAALAAATSLRVIWPETSQKTAPAPISSRAALKHRVRPWLRLAVQSVLISIAAARRRLRRKRTAKPCRILFYSSFHQYLDYLKAVVAADFAEIFVYNPVVLSWRDLLALGVNLLLDRPPLLAPRHAAASWRARWARLRTQPEFIARFESDGLPLWPLIEPFLAGLFERRFAELANLRQRLAAVLKRCRPNLVIVPQDVHDSPRLLVMLAQAAGIPTLVTEHGVIANYRYRVRPIADKIAIWGRNDMLYYLRHGYDPGRIRVIGQPVLERLWADAPAAAQALAAEASEDLSGAPGKSKAAVILYAAQPYVPISARNSPVEVVDLIRLVVDACRGRPGWRLIIKLHSLMDGSELDHLDTAGANVTVVRSGSIYSMLAEADVLVTWSSTAGLEGLAMGKPLISLQIPGKADYVPYVAAGAALGATTPVALAEAIDRVLSGAEDTAERRAQVNDFICGQAEAIHDLGGAARRFVDLAQEMAGCL